MAVFYHIISLLGGLAMFLYGMRILGDGLKASSGGTMKTMLAKVTNKPFLAFLLGVVVTCVIQSSKATIVLTVGLVGAGFLTFHQSIGIVLGANVGTAITAQIIRLMDLDSAENSLMYFFKADNLAPLALFIGIAIIMTTKRESKKNLGNIACGFGVLFMGLIYMMNTVSQFEEALSGLLTAFGSNYLLGFGAGALVTSIIQSSSAAVGIIQSIASSVGVTFNSIFAVIIGINMGDALTTYFVSRIGARPEQIRTAMVHIVFNIISALLLILAISVCRLIGLMSDDFWYSVLNSGGVANVHGLFRLVPAIVILPFIGLLERITTRLVPDHQAVTDTEESRIAQHLRELDPHLRISPILAMDEVGVLLNQMSEVAYANVLDCTQQIFSYHPESHSRIHEREDLLDQITDATGQYLVSLSPYIKRDRDFRLQNFMLKTSVCFERIGDNAMNVLHALDLLHEQDKGFSPTAQKELPVILDAIDEVLNLTLSAFSTRDAELAAGIEPLEEVIDDLTADLNSRHVARMSRNLCDATQGIQYQSILSALGTISDMCSDISIYITELSEESVRGREHEYIHKLHHSVNSEFQTMYQAGREKYYSRLMAIPAVPEA